LIGEPDTSLLILAPSRRSNYDTPSTFQYNCGGLMKFVKRFQLISVDDERFYIRKKRVHCVTPCEMTAGAVLQGSSPVSVYSFVWQKGHLTGDSTLGAQDLPHFLQRILKIPIPENGF
jgi:hypothetical protein